jgi:hypothetical protein
MLRRCEQRLDCEDEKNHVIALAVGVSLRRMERRLEFAAKPRLVIVKRLESACDFREHGAGNLQRRIQNRQ